MISTDNIKNGAKFSYNFFTWEHKTVRATGTIVSVAKGNVTFATDANEYFDGVTVTQKTAIFVSNMRSANGTMD
jgi:hypothetical protein